MNIEKYLTDEWALLTARAKLRDAVDVSGSLIVRYSEPHRVFHTARHLADVVGLLEEMNAAPELILAAWFHDAVYEPGRADNETRSAALARESLARCGMAEAGLEVVCKAVLATASHKTDNQLFEPLLDADLSILGASPEAYAAYSAAIRAEYRNVPEAAFTTGRLAFIRSVLGRPSIFLTPLAQARFEQAARRNLQEELRRLRGGES